MRYIFKFIIITFFSCVIHARVLIWDFGGIVFNPDKFGVGFEVGIENFLKYMVMDLKSPNIQRELFEFLETMMRDDKRFGEAGTAEGMPLPTIMRHWQAGTILGPDIVEMSKEHIKKMNKLGYFRSQYERNLMEKIIAAMFDPKILANNIYPLEKGVRLLKKCHEAKNADGTKRNINIGFSNWDPLSYREFYKRYKNIFKYFDYVIISGDIGKVKPDEDAFKYLINKLNLDPADCVLVDDQLVNAKGAAKVGIRSILLKNWDFEKLENDLKLWGAL